MSNAYTRAGLLALSQEELVGIVLEQQSALRASDQAKSETIEGSPPATPGAITFDQYNVFCRQVAENFPNGAVAILDRQLNYVYATGQELNRYGLSKEAFAGRPIGVLVSQQEAQRIRTKLQAVFQGESCEMEVVVDENVYLVSATPLVLEDGSIEQLVAVSQNITAQQIALRKAQESEAQFRALAENIPGAVYIITNDVQRDIVYISGRVKSLCGHTAEEFVNGEVNMQMLMHDDDRERVKVAFKEALAGNQPYHFTYRWKHRGGHECWIEEYGVNIVKDQRQYLQGILFDISEKKQQERELEQQNEDLKKTNTELDQFAYSVSHDLRAPLTSSMGMLYLLKDEQDQAQRDHFIEIIQQSLLRLDNFVQEIIHLTKNARTELKVEAIHLKSVIDEIIASQKYNADYDQVAIHTEIDQSEEFCTDSRRLWIVLNNLISNAIRYHFPLRENSYVQVTATVTQKELVLTVADNGIGIQQEHLEKVFNMFYRATDRKTGSGLGLYLVKETVERLEGSVSVDSTYEKGTSFTVRLPSLQHG